MPVTVTLKLFALAKLQVKVTDREVVVVVNVILEALREHVVPPFWARVMVPANPLADVAVIVEVPEDPALTTTRVGLADMVKSGGGGAAET